ncbi:ABC transporter ATP-binding protein [Nitrospira sp. Kam-Ns4a]
MAAIELSGVSVVMEQEALRADFTLSAEAGQFVALVGPNRSGKSLILKLCAGLVEPDAGTVRVLDRDLAELTEEERDEFRLRVGVVLQQPGLLSNLTVFNNVALPLRYHRGLEQEALEPLVMAWLEPLGLAAVRNRFPAELNQGEVRGAALARALVMEPDLLLLDGPTEGLDATMATTLGRLLAELRRARPVTILATLHGYSPLLEQADRVAFVRAGRVLRAGAYAALLAGADAEMRPYLEPVLSASKTLNPGDEVLR